MSFGKPHIADTSTELRQQEADRAAKIKESSDVINKTFDDKYGPQYYSGLGDAYRAYYKPQIAHQFTEANRATALRTADNANSSAANRVKANLAGENVHALQDVEGGALDAQTKAKQDVESKRGSLINFAEAGGSLENTAAQSRAAATSDIGRPTYSPLGDVFGRYTNTLAGAANYGNQGGNVNPFYQKQIDFLRGGRSSSGSSKVIGG